MKKIAWITDSTCTLPDAYCQAHHIYKVPLTLIAGDKTFKDGVDMSAEEAFELLQKENITTSQPAIGDFVALYEKLKETYEGAVSYHISSRLSGTFSASVQAGDIAEFPVVGVDSKAGVHAMSSVLAEAVERYEDGETLTDTLEYLKRESERIEIYFAAGSLEQLHKSGRVKGSQAFLGALLNIKPILHFEEGIVVPVEKVRSQKKVFRYLLDRLTEDYHSGGVRHISIFHGDDMKSAEKLQADIQTLFPEQPVSIEFINPVVGVLVGKGTIGLTWVKNY